MRLLYAFPEPLPLPRARGIQVAWMVEALCAAGVDVTLAHVPSTDGHPLSPLGRIQLPSRLHVVEISRSWPFPLQRWHSVTRYTNLLLAWIDSNQSGRSDIVFVRHLKLAYHLLRKRPELPLIYEAHEVFAATAPSAKRAKLAAQEAFVLANAAGVVFISGAVRDALQDQYVVGGREIVLHSAVDLPAESPEKDWSNCAQQIIYAGSFFNWKGVDDLVTAAADLPGCRITLIGGEGDDLARVSNKLAGKGADMILLPRLPADKVMAHLLDACIAVLPNRSEGVSQFTSPLKLFEYMGAGCAVVAADLPSVREVLAATDATWFEPGNPLSLANALRQLASDPEKAKEQGENLRRIAEHYTWQARGKALAEFATVLLADCPRLGSAA